MELGGRNLNNWTNQLNFGFFRTEKIDFGHKIFWQNVPLKTMTNFDLNLLQRVELDLETGIWCPKIAAVIGFRRETLILEL